MPILEPSALTADFVARFRAISTDTRTLKPGDLFFALRGESFNGNDFVDAAIANGAQGVVAERAAPNPLPSTVQYIQVSDALAAFRQVARAWRERFSIPVIGIAGSVGKTTTKELLAAILRGKFSSVLKTEKSQNGFIGIPMTLLALRPEHRAAVIEIGIDEIGAIRSHVDIVQPTAAIVTAIAPEHLEKLQDLATVAREECEIIFDVLKRGGIAALAWDEPEIRMCFTRLKGSMVAFGILHENRPVGVPFITATTHDHTLIIQGDYFDGESFTPPVPGEHNISNFLGALSLAGALGLTADEVREGIKHFVIPYGRNEIKILPGGTRVLCDYYNSNPASLAAGLKLLATFGEHKKIACLGDMLELGAAEERYHRDMAPHIEGTALAGVYFLGERMRWLFDELKTRAIYHGELRHFSDASILAVALARCLDADTALLIKGSRSMKMEHVFEALAVTPS